MDIKPETMLTVAAVGALAYTCMNKKKEVTPFAPSVVGGKKKSAKKSAVGRCGSGKRSGFRCTGISRSNPSVCKRWKKDSKCKKSAKKAEIGRAHV